MMRLLVHVEGQTEETFVNRILGPHLRDFGYSDVGVRLLGNLRRPRSRRGGIVPWPIARKDILRHVQEDQECVTTTIIDYYGLPEDWPGRKAATKLAVPKNAETIENAICADIRKQMGSRFDARRFIPYVAMHEFEAMLFSDCNRFAQVTNSPHLAQSFQKIRDGFASPEEIDNSPQTAPSKRIEALMPGYQKPLTGTLAVLEIGLDTIRRECLHFGRWLERLERFEHSERA